MLPLLLLSVTIFLISYVNLRRYISILKRYNNYNLFSVIVTFIYTQECMKCLALICGYISHRLLILPVEINKKKQNKQNPNLNTYDKFVSISIN